MHLVLLTYVRIKARNAARYKPGATVGPVDAAESCLEVLCRDGPCTTQSSCPSAHRGSLQTRGHCGHSGRCCESSLELLCLLCIPDTRFIRLFVHTPVILPNYLNISNSRTATRSYSRLISILDDKVKCHVIQSATF
jgi:hypothetical protein